MFSYIAGFCDGDGSICIGKCNSGYQLKLEFTQCNKNFLELLNSYFDNIGKIYKDNREHKYKTECAHQLRFCGHNSTELLLIMKNYGIVKAEQASLALEFLELINKHNKTEEKEQLCLKMKELNKDKSSYIKSYDNISDAYIAGLFDAEGNVYIKEEPKFKHYIQITQKCDPVLISKIKTYLSYGNIYKSEPFRLRFYSKLHTNNFYNIVKDFSLIKLEKLEYLVNLVNKK